MHRVAEWIKNRRNVTVDPVRMHPHVAHRQRNIFRERAWPVHTHALRVRAQMSAPRQTISAMPANYMPLAADDLAGEKILHVRTHFHDLPHELMPDHQGHRYGFPCPLVP